MQESKRDKDERQSEALAFAFGWSFSQQRTNASVPEGHLLVPCRLTPRQHRVEKTSTFSSAFCTIAPTSPARAVSSASVKKSGMRATLAGKEAEWQAYGLARVLP